ncbi:MAG: hypothetical protein WCJ30_29320 [Deltaproteobacteria bacterium]
MRVAFIAFIALASTACGSANYGDASVDTVPLNAQVFDVDRTPDGGTPPLCPGDLFGRASQNQATCARGPEVCRNANGASMIECQCGASPYNTWSCHEYRP